MSSLTPIVMPAMSILPLKSTSKYSANAPFSPSHVTYRHLTKGLINSNRISEVVDLLREMLMKGHGTDSLVYNNLIAGFIKLGNMEKALELFQELQDRCYVYDGIVHATLMEAYFKRGMEKEAMTSYKELLDLQLARPEFRMNATTSNTLLKVLLKWGKMSDACALFNRMLLAHTPASFQAVNTDSYNLMVNEYCRLNKFAEAVAVFKKSGTKPCAIDVGCCNNIIGKLCAVDGWVLEAEKLFDEMHAKSVNPDAATYGFLIDGYFRAGRVNDALRRFNKVVGAARLKANVGFYNKVLGGLVEKGRVGDAAQVFGQMAEGVVKTDPMSYEILVMGLCMEGSLDQSKNLLDGMVKNGVTIPDILCEVVVDAFGKEGRRDEIQRVFEQKGYGMDPATSIAQTQQAAA